MEHFYIHRDQKWVDMSNKIWLTGSNSKVKNSIETSNFKKEEYPGQHLRCPVNVVCDKYDSVSLYWVLKNQDPNKQYYLFLWW